MSNSRLFCMGYSVMMVLTGILKLLGLYTPTYPGFEDVVCINLTALGVGAISVIISGDRDRRKA